MGYNFRSYNPHQGYLLPPSLDDWLPQGHLARFISETVDLIDLRAVYSYYRANGQGRAAYHPAMMVKILFYAYCVGIASSRKIEASITNDVAFRWLAPENRPDFRTISDFRRIHLEALKSLFVQVLLLCQRAGLVKAGLIVLDGTKVKANAALAKNRKYAKLTAEEMALMEKVEAILAKAAEVDRKEDALYGDARGDELPEELATTKKRLEKIREAKAQLEAEAAVRAAAQQEKIEAREREEKETGRKKPGRKPKEPDPSVDEAAKANLTDPDSRIQKTRHGHIQGYNAQAAVSEDQIILACDVVQDANDLHQLIPMMNAATRNAEEIGVKSGLFLADAGYCSEGNLGHVFDPKTPKALIAIKKEHKQRTDEEPPARGRPPNVQGLRERMERKLRTTVGRALYRFRGRIVEPVFGQIKECRGLVRFLLRGLEKVQGEFCLWCMTHNILKLYRKTIQAAART